MRAGVSSFLLVCLLACSGENVVGGEEKTKAEQLEASLPAWCQSTCGKLTMCPQNGGCDCDGDVCNCTSIDADCPDECQEGWSRFTTQGEACAAVGERFKRCFDQNGCDVLDDSSLCAPTPVDFAECPELEDPAGGDSEVPVEDPTGPVSGTAGSYSGTAGSYSGTAGSANIGGPNYVPITCQNGEGSGGGMPASGAGVVCEESRGACSDGHSYSWICALSSQGQTACSCLLDSQVVGAFDPGSGCPTLPLVNTGCGWHLAAN